MKLYELTGDLLLAHGNESCDLEIETEEIRNRFGICGVNGRISDIPSYLGGYDVKGCGTDYNRFSFFHIVI